MPWDNQIEDNTGRLVASLESGNDFYVFPDGTRMAVPSDLGWCNGCQAFRLVETLRSADELRADARGLTHLIGEQMLADQLERATAWRYVLQARKSLPRCLDCGGTDHFRLPPMGQWMPSPGGRPGRVRRRVNLIHGERYVTPKLYDVEGRPIPHD